MGHEYWGNMGMGFGYGVGWIIQLALWVLIIVAIIWLVKWAMKETHARDHKKREDEAVHILRERYARGEISKEEFKERRQELMEK